MLYIVHISKFDDEGYERFVNEMKLAASQDVIPVEINSNGGSIDILFAMYDLLDAARENGSKIATVCIGRAMSAGADLLASGDKGLRFAAPNSRILVHEGTDEVNASTAHGTYSNAREMRRQTDESFKIFDRNCGKAPGYTWAELIKRGNKDWYMTPKVAKKYGIVDHIQLPNWRTEIRW